MHDSVCVVLIQGTLECVGGATDKVMFTSKHGYELAIFRERNSPATH